MMIGLFSVLSKYFTVVLDDRIKQMMMINISFIRA